MIEAAYDAFRRSDWDAVVAHCLAIIERVPDHAAARHLLGLTFYAAGRPDDAVSALKTAFALDPSWPRGRDLAIAYAAVHQWRAATAVLDRFTSALDAETLTLYFAAAVESGFAQRALRSVTVAGRDIRHHPHLLCEYARALHAGGYRGEAERILQICLQEHSSLARAYDLLGGLYHDTNRGDSAFRAWAMFAQRQPESGYAQLRLAVACSCRGRLRASRAARLRAVALGLDRQQDRSTVVRLMLFDSGEAPADILAACRSASLESGTCVPGAPVIRTAPRNTIRIGYLAGEFHSSPASHFLLSFLNSHDPKAIQAFIYNNSSVSDRGTAAYKRLGLPWRDVARRSDQDVVRLIKADRIDVLVDLSGHFPANRLAVFAQRPTPIQATYPNYPCTTGCSQVDYFFTDIWTSPEGTDWQYSERLYRLPSGYLVYCPPRQCAQPTRLPCTDNGYVTFGLFQQLCKLTDETWDAVADILRSVPRSRLVLHNGDAELDRPQSETVHFLKSQLVLRDIDPYRLRCRGPLPHREHLTLVGSVDVALDSWPYGGQTTTSESLWMGVPVITMTGRTHVSRVSGALLQRVGLTELVTDCHHGYVAAATKLASDWRRLAHLRSTLRERTKRTLTNGYQLAKELEHAYRQWCRELA